MQFVFYVIFVGAVVLADQFTKALVVANIPLGGHVAFLPGFLTLPMCAIPARPFPPLRECSGCSP